MAFIDDWGGTAADDRKRLQEKCSRVWCLHMRYLHGESVEIRAGFRSISHTPGKCQRCKCEAFEDNGSITRDDVLDADEWFKGAGDVTLTSIGIGPANCGQVITRWLEAGTIDVPCIKPSGHEGTHEA